MIHRTLNLPQSKSFFFFGPRQTGKSSLVRLQFPEHEMLSINLLHQNEFERFSKHPEILRSEVLQRSPLSTHVLIDEIQKVPALLDEVHAILESGQPSVPHFILTGSSARKLKAAGANMLGGRALTRRLYPFTHLELGDRFDLNRTLSTGTLPPIYLENDPAMRADLLRSYAETYVREEIQMEAVVRNIGTFLRFLSVASHEEGNLLNYSAIARDSGTSSVTVKEYFQILEDTLIGFFLFPFSRSQRKRTATHPRFYLFDGGVQRALAKQLSVPLEPRTSPFGHAFEAWIIRETRTLADYHQKDLEFSFYRTDRGAEVDLVIETPRNKIWGVEIKSSESPTATDFQSGLNSLAESVEIHEKICVCRAPRESRVGDTQVLPWRIFFQKLLDEA